MDVSKLNAVSHSPIPDHAATKAVAAPADVMGQIEHLLQRVIAMLRQANAAHEGGGHTGTAAPAPSTVGKVGEEVGKVSKAGTARDKVGNHPMVQAGTGKQPASAAAGGASAGDVSRQTLAAGHGWGAQGGGTSGGARADAAHVYTVSNRAQLVAALGGKGDAPKIIQIKGTIDMNLGADGRQMTKAQFGNEKAQLAHDMARVGSNTTIVGLGADAGIVNGGLDVSGAHNDIIRNIHFGSPSDLFPGTDAKGNPHGRVYSIEAKGTTNLWVDHNSFADGKTPAGSITGDQIDFTNGANFATISYNKFSDHNKGILIGSDDKVASDAGKLNVTIDHNQFDNEGTRAPRVRYGHVEVANNLFTQDGGARNKYQYSLGVGKDATMTSQNNAYEMSGVNPSRLVEKLGNGSLTDTGSTFNGKAVDLSVSAVGGGPGAGGIGTLDATGNVAAIVTANAGAGTIGQGY